METKLTSAEVSQLWGTFMGDSSQICVLSYFIDNVEDANVKAILQFARDTAGSHIKKIETMFSQEGHEVPHGFKIDKDVTTSAPKMFSDNFMLEYIHEFARIGLRGHSVNLSVAVRQDSTEFFKECLSDSVQLYEMAKDLLISKDLYIRSAYLETEHKVDYVEHQNFLAGFFGDKRPLTVPEVTNLYMNFQRNALGAATLIGFSQMAQSQEVRKYFIRGKEIAEKHCEIVGSHLKKNDLPTSVYWDSEISEDTHVVFSDKLMMYIVHALTSVGMSFYGLGMGTSLKKDLGVMYNRFLAEIQLFAEDGANILIEKSWLESPPKVRES
ncbi:DUF3231 family protein [Halalkalibacter alkalisediminis]|uniref:DUF3231 family protein n=1 Tax=Halalkalibacter alkalisediminis TaxID=935616 RepID=A0ABV6NJT7_9BACI|nr:DUF3231 family protein [Halalkalibacter alkalisediminis]